MSLKQAKALAQAAKLLPATPATATPTGTAAQLATLTAVIESAANKVEEKKEKKEKFDISQAINTTRQPGGQGRQPQRILAGQMPAFLGGFLFASASARVRKSEAELTAVVSEATQNGKLMELLASGDSWQYQTLAPDTRTGFSWQKDAPETVFHLPKLNARMALLAQFDAAWEEAFGKEEEAS